MDENANDILREIRDLQRQHLDEYRRVTERSLALQEKAVTRQEQIGRLYRRVVAVAAVVVLAAVAYLLHLLIR